MRIRTIKPSFWRSDDITVLPMGVRLLFVGLWSYVDDNGVGLDDYRQIAADLFALEEDQTAIRQFVRDGLATLSRRLLVVRYKIGDRCLIFVTNWDRHQKVDRPATPRFPRPPADFDPSTSGNHDGPDHVANVSRDYATASPRARVAGTGEQGKRGTGEKILCDAATDVTTDRARQDHQPVATGASNHDLADHAVATIIGNSRPPSIRKSLTQRAEMLLNQGIQGTDLTTGLVEWRNTPNARVTWLDYKVSDAISRRETKERPTHLAPVTELATSDQRVQAGQRIAAQRRARRLAAEQNQQQPVPALPGAAS